MLDSIRQLCLQNLLQSGYDSIDVLRIVAPIAALFLLSMGSAFELENISSHHFQIQHIFPLIVGSGVLAFSLNVCSYAFLKQTSALTVSLSGIFKDVLLLGISRAWLGSKVGSEKILGYGVATLCALIHQYWPE